ncbi:DNA polymerase III subunit psi [Edwardsiella piscicida]|uniref:DNA polymerase III subunit psi n=3 Tax=Edwardsiella TaxID=635 RepID=A0A0H3DMK6_EDWTF|nr:DNA polymerase III subunit psi [Edwardsiella piscicida]ACY83323.1 DNA polymerase III, psi subunit [Edwardsiella tarda EIB202]ADM40553.1 DNA polymerase III psi subunit [Edwardsiella tarda FL6-60]AGH72596.1 DNA polymerase III psi subunit [Edwardsiella piscicida C07-087]AOP41986.1 DNA polymerase III subunit psi [Edwardsiella piscicida]ARD17868.1 DNA polymerase III subunit psi [Edwardsiella piscicida]
MTSRRDQLLQQLGITQWVLRRPALLRGEVAITLSAQTRLLIVSEAPLSPDDLLLCDILRALSLTAEQAVILTPEQYEMLSDRQRYLCWWLGESASSEACLRSPALGALYHNPGAKRALWQQICHEQHHFFPDPGGH